MNIILAIDLKDGDVVHGCSGNRDTYTPLTWGLCQSSDPIMYVSQLKPKYLYIADLDRISGNGDHTNVIVNISSMVHELWVDRGDTDHKNWLLGSNIHTIIGTETINEYINEFKGGFLSIDIKDGIVLNNSNCLPTKYPDKLLCIINKCDNFDGCIVLDISSVGTLHGINREYAEHLRDCYDKPLYFGGGIKSMDDIWMLSDVGYEGVIVSTAVNNGSIPLNLVQKGVLC